MGNKKPFIDRKKARHFHVVHRSMRDPLAGVDDAPQLVLQEFTPPNCAPRNDDDAPLFSYDNPDNNDNSLASDASASGDEDANDDDAGVELGAAAQHGVFFPDQNDYDYLQHMREVGRPGSATVWLEAPATARNKHQNALNSVPNDGDDTMPRRKVRFADLPADVLPPHSMAAAIPQGEQGLELDADVMEALEALDCDEYIAEFDDDYVHSFQGGDGGADDDQAARNNHGDDQDDCSDFDFDDDDEYDDVRTAFTGLSMTSSAMHRNAGLSLLDERFDKVMEEYDDDDIGALDSDAADSDDNDQNDDGHQQQSLSEYASMFDDFLDNQDLRGARLISARHDDPLAELDEVRQELGDARLDGFLAGNDGFDDVVEQLVPLDDDEHRDEERWDCETVLTTYTNTENRPRVLDAKPRPKRVIQLSHKTGMPLGVLKPRVCDDETSDSGDADSSNEERVNLGESRSRTETPEEKKQRKLDVKQAKRFRRQEKKATKLAFVEEKKRLLAVQRPRQIVHAI